MKKANWMKRKLSSPIVTVALFAIAAGLLLGSTIGGTRAALTYYSETYASRVQMFNIGVSLLENDTKVSWRDYGSESDGAWSENTGVLLANMLGDGESIQLGKSYPEILAVTNSGTIDEYVRVSIYKYWLNPQGEKVQDLSPELIELNLVNLGDAWMIDEDASTKERTVLYYKNILPVDATTPALSDTLRLNPSIGTKVRQEKTTNGNYTRVDTIFEYDGYRFQIEVEVDAVQTHNAADAILSAWGCRVEVDEDGSLSLQ